MWLNEDDARTGDGQPLWARVNSESGFEPPVRQLRGGYFLSSADVRVVDRA
jgi:hypothetical protein